MIRRIHTRCSRADCAALLLMFVFFLQPVVDAAETDNPQLPMPDISLQPEDVVQIVINSLANNDQPYADAGIAVTFNFTSPANKANTGPLERFTSMVKGPIFGPMLNHKSSDMSEVVLQGNRAYLIVQLITIDDRELHFAFRLGLQTMGEFKNMWLTEAVWPLKQVDQGLEI